MHKKAGQEETAALRKLPMHMCLLTIVPSFFGDLCLFFHPIPLAANGLLGKISAYG